MAFKFPTKNIGAIQRATSTLPTSTAPINPINPISAKASAINTGMTGTPPEQPKPLTEEQYRKAREKYTPEQIIQFEKIRLGKTQQPTEQLTQQPIQSGEKNIVKKLFGNIGKEAREKMDKQIYEKALKGEKTGVVPIAINEIFANATDLASNIGAEILKAPPQVLLSLYTTFGKQLPSAITGKEYDVSKEKGVDLPIFGNVKPYQTIGVERAEAGSKMLEDVGVEPKTAAGLSAAGAFALTIPEIIGATKMTAELYDIGEEAIKKLPETTKNIFAPTTKPSKISELVSPKTEDTSLSARVSRNIERSKIAKQELQQQSQPVQNAVKYNIPQEDASLINTANRSTKKEMARMVDAYENFKANPRTANRPENIIGENIMKKVKVVSDNSKKISGQINDTVKKIATKKVSTEDVGSQFLDDLQRIGVNIDDTGKLDFSNSIIKNSKSEQSIIEDVWNELNKDLTAGDAHLLRQRWFNDLDLAKQQGQITGTVPQVVNKVRSGLMKSISDVSKEYSDLSKQEAIILKSLRDFTNLVGKKWTGKADDILQLRVGEIANRLTGKASADAYAILNQIDHLAGQYGYKGGVSNYDLVFFKDFLEKQLGLTQRGGLAGQVQLGLQPQEMLDVASSGNIVNKILSGAVKVGEKFAGITPEEKMLIIRQLIK